MCAAATAVGLAATSAVLLVLVATQGKLKQDLLMGLNENSNYTNLVPYTDDPNIKFILYTRSSSPYQLRFSSPSGLKNSGFNESHPTKIIIHGFLSNITGDVFMANKDAYLDSGDYNVVGMDWSVLCEFEYLSAINGARKAGNGLGDFLNWLSDNAVDLDKVHLVGHSLGAHVAGIAGNRVKNGKVGRITGLDPAAPGFRETDTNFRLDVNDAKIVDVIHTYMKVLSLAQPVGHVDFYPNGGRWQPGCPDIYDVWHVTESIICNHGRAYYFFAESIKNKNAFRSKRCKSVDDALYSRCFEATDVYMGQVETYKFGLYYVRTRPESPYSL